MGAVHSQLKQDLAAALAVQAAADAASAESAKERKRRQAKEARERKKTEGKTLAENLEKWRAGEVRNFPGSYAAPVALRLIEGGQRIETSRGAIVPARVARAAWALICNCDSDPAFNWGPYTGLKIHAGSVVIGCHTIGIPEIERIAAALGLVDAAA